jgi:hypothetical protein
LRLQLKLVNRLIDSNEIDSAIGWARRLNIPPEKLPGTLLDEMDLHVEQ